MTLLKWKISLEMMPDAETTVGLKLGKSILRTPLVWHNVYICLEFTSFRFIYVTVLVVKLFQYFIICYVTLVMFAFMNGYLQTHTWITNKNK